MYQRQCHPTLDCGYSRGGELPGTCLQRTSKQHQQQQPIQRNCNQYYDDCSLCLSHPECAWAIDRNSNQSSCMERDLITCPPQHDWYFDQCPCSDCDIPQDQFTCTVGIDGYNLGYLRVLNDSFGECQPRRPNCCCLTSDDCDSSSYCLFSTNGPRDNGFCVPYENEGGSCGGNMSFECQKQCHPSLECGYSKGSDNPGSCKRRILNQW
jgi:hypothetical protein